MLHLKHLLFGIILALVIGWILGGGLHQHPPGDFTKITPLPPWPLFNLLPRLGQTFRQLHLAMNPGPLLALQYGISYTTPKALYTISKLDVPDALKDGPKSISALAKIVGAQEARLFRVIRYLSSEGFFELNGDMVSLTDAGKFLQSDKPESMKWCMIHWNEEASKALDSLYLEVKTGTDAFANEYDGKDMFQIYQERPSSAEAFTRCMKSLFAGPNSAVVTEFDFSLFPKIVDLGGGLGSLANTILLAYGGSSKITDVISFDLPEVVKYAVPISGIKFVGGSFFELSTIPKGYDLYLINGVLHDWSDEECIKILNNAKAAMKQGGTILVIDFEVNPSSPFFNSMSRLDVFMMAVSSGYFRTAEEHSALWPKAGLQLKRTIATRSPNVIWELQAL